MPIHTPCPARWLWRRRSLFNFMSVAGRAPAAMAIRAVGFLMVLSFTSSWRAAGWLARRGFHAKNIHIPCRDARETGSTRHEGARRRSGAHRCRRHVSFSAAYAMMATFPAAAPAGARASSAFRQVGRAGWRRFSRRCEIDAADDDTAPASAIVAGRQAFRPTTATTARRLPSQALRGWLSRLPAYRPFSRMVFSRAEMFSKARARR